MGTTLQFILYKIFWLGNKTIGFPVGYMKETVSQFNPYLIWLFFKKSDFWDLLPEFYTYSNTNPQKTYTNPQKQQNQLKTPNLVNIL